MLTRFYDHMIEHFILQNLYKPFEQNGYSLRAVSYTHLDVYKRQIIEFVSESSVVCKEVQTLSVSSVEDSEEREEVSGGPGGQP